MFIGIRKSEPGILVLAPSMHGQEAASLRTDFIGEVNNSVGHIEVIVESRYERGPDTRSVMDAEALEVEHDTLCPLRFI